MNFKEVKGKKFSGRVLWSISGKMPNFPGEEFPDSIGFFCGAETKEGYIDDGSTLLNIEKTLKQLFSDHLVDIDLAENFHAVYLNKDETCEQLEILIKERLSSTNAIEKNDF